MNAPLWQPRVEFGYPSMLAGLPCTISFPFVIGVLGGFSGEPAEPPPPVVDREFLDGGALGLPGLFKTLAPALNLAHEDCALSLRPRALEHFSAAGLVSLLPAGCEHLAPWVLQQPSWRGLAAAWRGLAYLLECLQPDEKLRVHVLHLHKRELGRTLKRYRGTSWDQSPIFKLIHERRLGTRGEYPLACVIGDYDFDHSAADVETLDDMARICETADAAFLAAAAPALMQMESWQELANPRDLLKIFTTPEYAKWRALRDSERMRHLALALPGFQPRDALAKEPSVRWVNPAFALAAVIGRAFRTEGWCARIEGTTGGGACDGLAQDAVGRSTEVPVAERRAAELARAGLVSLVGNPAAIAHAGSLHRPPEYDWDDANRAAELAARLSHQLCLGLVRRHLRCFVRELEQESNLDAFEIARRVNEWLATYVDEDPTTSSSAQQALRPLGQAHVSAEERVGGGWAFLLTLRLSHQVELAPRPGVTRL